MSTCRVLAPEPGPETLKERRWGGHRLARLRGRADLAGRPIGESWEFSTLPGSQSRTAGADLRASLGRPLPFLAKLIETRLPLSVQVHPDDDPVTGRPGKEEAWVVLEADPGAHVLVGLRPGIDRARLEALTRAADADPARGPELLAALVEIPVVPGTCVLLRAGTVHAIGGGILLAEIQQPTDCTHRLFDHGSGRELHVDQALATTVVDAAAQVWRPGEPVRELGGKHVRLSACPAGRHAFDASGVDRLVVAVAGGARLVGDAPSTLTAGDLRLCTGGPFELDVEAGGLAVVAWVDPQRTA